MRGDLSSLVNDLLAVAEPVVGRIGTIGLFTQSSTGMGPMLRGNVRTEWKQRPDQGLGIPSFVSLHCNVNTSAQYQIH